MSRRAGMRDRCEAEIVKHLRSCGRKVILLESTEDGMPDLLVIWGGGFALLEVKDPKDGVMSKRQKAWHASYRGPRGTLHVVTSKEQAMWVCALGQD